MARDYVRSILDLDERLKFVHGLHYPSRAAFAQAKLGCGREGILELERANETHFNVHDTRWMLTRLDAEHPELAARFTSAAGALKAHLDSKQGIILDDMGHMPLETAAAEAARNQVVYEIRALPGFSSFGMPPDWVGIVAAAAQGALIYLVATDKGMAAMGLYSSGGNPSPLPQGSPEKNRSLPSQGGSFDGTEGSTQPGSPNPPANDWKDGITRVTVAAHTIEITDNDVVAAALPFLNAEFETQGGDRMQVLPGLLEWLADHVTALIDGVLTELKAGETPVFVQPVGTLSMLPLHLQRVMDRDGVQGFGPRQMTFFYWARGLSHSLKRQGERITCGALVINNPQPLPPEFDALELADFETQIVLSHVPGVELRGNDAHVEDVASELTKAAVAHFCCHGTMDRRFFYSGILLLAYPEILMYRHLRDMAEVPARLVALSACRSGSAALKVDSVLSLPALFLSAGVAAVLGTLWHADEMATLLLRARFYSL